MTSVELVHSSAFSSNVYRAADALVDAGTDADALPPVDDVLLTHSHFDHLAAAVPYVERTGAEVHLHADEWGYALDRREEVERSAGALDLGYDPLDLEPSFVEDGDVLDVGCEVEVVHTPGHTPGSVCYYVEAERALFTGDTVFGNGAPGDGDREALEASILRLSRLEVESIYPGHMEPAHDDVELKFRLALSNL